MSKETMSAAWYSANKDHVNTTRDQLSSVFRIQLADTIPSNQLASWKHMISELYTNLYAANSGSIPFTMEHLSRYMYVTSCMVGIIASLDRAIKTCKYFRSANQAIPEQLFMAYGLDIDSFQSNVADAIDFRNQILSLFNSNVVINTALYRRKIKLYNYIYREYDSDLDVYNVILQREVLFVGSYTNNDEGIFRPIISRDATESESVPNGTGISFEVYKSEVSAFFNKFLNDQYYLYISSYMKKLYGKEYGSLSLDSTLAKYDSTINNMIQNSRGLCLVLHNANGTASVLPTNIEVSWTNGTFNTAIQAQRVVISGGGSSQIPIQSQLTELCAGEKRINIRDNSKLSEELSLCCAWYTHPVEGQANMIQIDAQTMGTETTKTWMLLTQNKSGVNKGYVPTTFGDITVYYTKNIASTTNISMLVLCQLLQERIQHSNSIPEHFFCFCLVGETNTTPSGFCTVLNTASKETTIIDSEDINQAIAELVDTFKFSPKEIKSRDKRENAIKNGNKKHESDNKA